MEGETAMNLPPNRMKLALKNNQPSLGLWSQIPDPLVAEMLTGTRFDWLVLDMEHGPYDLETTVSMLQAMNGASMAPAVRPPWNDFVAIKRLLDAGVNSLIIPYVQTVEEARKAVAATRYPPHGNRGVAGGTRGTMYGRVKDYHANAHKEIFLTLQIETAEAVEQIEEIGAIEGVDALFIGPADLSASMGHLGNISHPEVQEKIAEALERMRKTPVKAGILSFDPPMAKKFIEMGFDFVCVASDTSMLVKQADDLAAVFDRNG